MKKIFFFCSFLILLLASCAQFRPDKLSGSYTSKKHLRALMKESSKYNTSSLINEVLSDGVYTYSEVKRLQDEDVKYMNEHWTEEEIKEFRENFVYGLVIMDGDTLKHKY